MRSSFPSISELGAAVVLLAEVDISGEETGKLGVTRELFPFRATKCRANRAPPPLPHTLPSLMPKMCDSFKRRRAAAVTLERAKESSLMPSAHLTYHFEEVRER